MTAIATIDHYLETTHQRTESGLMALAKQIMDLERQMQHRLPLQGTQAEVALAHYRHAFALVTKTSVGQPEYEELMRAYREFRE